MGRSECSRHERAHQITKHILLSSRPQAPVLTDDNGITARLPVGRKFSLKMVVIYNKWCTRMEKLKLLL